MNRTRIKICGITRIDDGIAAAEAGAHAIGLVFWPQSPRAVALSAARGIVEKLPPFVAAIGLFVDPSAAEVNAALDAVPLYALQFHGNESAAFCEQFHRPYLKAIPVGPESDLLQYALRYPSASGLLFDTYQPGGPPGGTGQSFDWNQLSPSLRALLPRPIVLSGGLSPENVRAAVRQVRPAAVDVSSGVEALDANGQRRKGIKDPARIAAFIEEVNRADAAG